MPPNSTMTGPRNGRQQFFTAPLFIDYCIQKALDVIGAEHVHTYWDPSSGTGDAGAAVLALMRAQE